MRFWIDENLTPRLAQFAHARGYESTTSRDRAKLRLSDERLYREVRAGDWVLVTNNRTDFERLLEQAEVHPGLVVLPLRKRDEQITMFESEIAYIEASAAAVDEQPSDWMVNRVVEVDEHTNECAAYLLPDIERPRDV